MANSTNASVSNPKRLAYAPRLARHSTRRNNRPSRISRFIGYSTKNLFTIMHSHKKCKSEDDGTDSAYLEKKPRYSQKSSIFHETFDYISKKTSYSQRSRFFWGSPLFLCKDTRPANLRFCGDVCALCVLFYPFFPLRASTRKTVAAWAAFRDSA